MATQWQLECINALSTSPTAWDLFKAKQKNRKMLDQFVNRLFPYKIVKNKAALDNNDLSFNHLLKKLESIKHDLDYTCPIYCNFKFNLDLSVIQQLLSLDKLHDVYDCDNTFCRFYTKGDLDSFCIRNSRSLGKVIFISNDIQENFSSAEISRIEIISNASYTKETIIRFIKDLKVFEENGLIILPKKEKDKVKKVKRSYSNNLNIGIEIEYDGIETPIHIQKKLSNLGIISFNSGFDGNSPNRLRENRIRLDGIKGIKGLYVLLEHMKQDCKLASNSSVHMHIDCKYDSSTHFNVNDTFAKMYQNWDKEPFHKLLKNSKFSYIAEIFDFQSKETIKRILENTKFNSDFNTIEYRFCKVSLDYKDFILQMICLIHITECLKHSCSMNKNLLMLLMLAVRGNSRLKPFTTKKGRSPLIGSPVKTSYSRDSCNEVEIASETFDASVADQCQIETGRAEGNIIAIASYHPIPNLDISSYY